MVNLDKLKKQLKENINDKSDGEILSLTESLVAEYLEAYAKDDLKRLKEISAVMDDFKDNLRDKYDNVNAVFNGVELQQLKNYHVLQQYQFDLLHGKDKILMYKLLINEISNKLISLRKILLYYFANAVGDGDNVKPLDNIIGDIRDEIIDLSDVADMYFRDSTADGVNLEIETSKEIIHDVFNYDYLEFFKDNGMVEIQMQLMEIYKINHQCNKDYKQLKLEIDDLFSKNNGFKAIAESFIDMLKKETDVGASADVVMDYLPEYDIATATFIAPKFPDIVGN